MNLVHMAPKFIDVLKFEVPTLRVLAPDLLSTLLSLFTSYEMLGVKVVVHDRRSTICKGMLLYRKPLIANAIRTLCCVHEKRETIRTGNEFNPHFWWFCFDD
jgi:hypothetical protein